MFRIYSSFKKQGLFQFPGKIQFIVHICKRLMSFDAPPFNKTPIRSRHIVYDETKYPKTHWSNQFPSLKDPFFIDLLKINSVLVCLKLNPTDSRGYRALVSIVSKKMHTVFNRDYSFKERIALQYGLVLLATAYEQYGLIAQIEIAGNNSQSLVSQGVTKLGNKEEPSLLHGHIIGRGDPSFKYIGNIPLNGPEPGKIFNMRGSGKEPGNKQKIAWDENKLDQIVIPIRNSLHNILSEKNQISMISSPIK